MQISTTSPTLCWLCSLPLKGKFYFLYIQIVEGTLSSSHNTPHPQSTLSHRTVAVHLQFVPWHTYRAAEVVVLTLGNFKNVTHSEFVVGLEKSKYKNSLNLAVSVDS